MGRKIEHGIRTGKKDEELLKKFDIVVYEFRGPDGKVKEPWPDAISAVSVFAGDFWISENREDAALSREGLYATQGNLRDNLLWGYVCPTNKRYREDFLEFVSNINTRRLHLDEVGFPDENYCYCERCKKLFGEGEERYRKRAEYIKGFLEEIREVTNCGLSITLYPDPPNLLERFGLDVFSVREYVDFFTMPIYAIDYRANYWIKSIIYSARKIGIGEIYIELCLKEESLKGLPATLALVSEAEPRGIIFVDPDDNLKKLAEILKEEEKVWEFIVKYSGRRFEEVVMKIIDLCEQ